MSKKCNLRLKTQRWKKSRKKRKKSRIEVQNKGSYDIHGYRMRFRKIPLGIIFHSLCSSVISLFIFGIYPSVCEYKWRALHIKLLIQLFKPSTNLRITSLPLQFSASTLIVIYSFHSLPSTSIRPLLKHFFNYIQVMTSLIVQILEMILLYYLHHSIDREFGTPILLFTIHNDPMSLPKTLAFTQSTPTSTLFLHDT